MALEAFYNLKEKKKKNIFDAMKVCLHNKNYDELSVGDIVKEADISRGSFYNYFTDKNDAIYTLVADSLMNKIEFFKESILKNDGNIFEATIELFKNVKSGFDERISERINERLVYNMKVYMNIVTRMIYSEKHIETVEALVSWLFANTTIGKEKLVDVRGMSNLLELLIATSLNELVSVFIMTDRVKRHSDLNGKLEIIRNGIYNKRNK